MQIQKYDLILVRVVLLLEVPSPRQAAVVSCFQMNLGTQRALPYCLAFLRMCDKCVGQRSDCVVRRHASQAFRPCKSTGQSSYGNRDHHQTVMGILLFLAIALGSENQNVENADQSER